MKIINTGDCAITPGYNEQQANTHYNTNNLYRTSKVTQIKI